MPGRIDLALNICQMKDPRFPELNAKQLNTLKSYGKILSIDERCLLFEPGQSNYNFYAVLEGEITVEDPSNDDEVIVKHQKNEFSGDNSMLSNRVAIFNGYAEKGSTILEIEPDHIKEAIAKHSDISDVLLNAFLLRQETVLDDIVGGIKLVGNENSNKTYEIRDFMEKNHIWFHFIDVDKQEEALELLAHFDVCKEDLPVLIANDQTICKNPTIEEVARNTGVLSDFEDRIFDVLVVGAGPAGLAASVYAASEGLDCVTIDSNAPGGQAGKSSKIENYLGFPTGISGGDLANRAYVQAQKFGCHISIPHRAKSIRRKGNHFIVEASNGKTIETKSIITATGATYSRLPLERLEHFEGSGVFYSATGMNVSSCTDEIVGVVGGGNSAGQAAMFLSGFAKEVMVLLRGNDLGAKMSDYLVQRLEAKDNITIHLNTEVTQLHGDSHLEKLTITHSDKGTKQVDITNLFTFIGAKPCTDWIGDMVVTDPKGFICTGSDIPQKAINRCAIYSNREPQALETSVPGCFAVGDVRKGSVKRVAGAVGEGSVVVSQIHQYLGDIARLSYNESK